MSSPPSKSSPPTPRRRAFDALVSTGGGTTPLAPIAQAHDVQQRERSGSDPSNPPAHWPDLSSSESTTRMPRRKPRRLTTTAARRGSAASGGGLARPAGAAAGGLRRAGSSAAAAAGGLRRSGSNESVTSAHSTGHSLQFLRNNDEWDDDDSSKAASLTDVSDVAHKSSSSSTNSKVMDLRPSSSAVAGMDESSLFSLNHLNHAAVPDIVSSNEEMSVASGHSGYFSAYLAGILAKPDAADERSVDASTITASTPCPLAVQRKRRRMYIRRCARAMCTFVALAALSGTTIYLIVEEEPLWEAWFAGQEPEADRDYRRLPQGAPRIPPGVDHFENELMATFGDAPQHLHANRDRERVRKAMAHGPRLERRNFPANLHERQRQRYLRSSNGTIAGGDVAVDEMDAGREHSVDEYYENAAGRDGYRSVTQKDRDVQEETVSAWS